MSRKEKMKNQNNQRRQFVWLATITAIFILSAFVSAFALGDRVINNKNIAFDHFSLSANQNSLFETGKAVDLLNVQSNAFPVSDFKAAANYPKPDFSEIEKWYEVVKYEYGDFEGGENTLYFWLKPKNDNRPGFYVYYYDKDDANIEGPDAALCWECHPNDPAGTVQKYHSIAPTETNMKRVAAVKIIRQKN
jgi:hypothetical protein